MSNNTSIYSITVRQAGGSYRIFYDPAREMGLNEQGEKIPISPETLEALMVSDPLADRDHIKQAMDEVIEAESHLDQTRRNFKAAAEQYK